MILDSIDLEERILYRKYLHAEFSSDKLLLNLQVFVKIS